MIDQPRNDELLTDVRGRVPAMTLNRPEVRNAVTTGMAGGILDAVARLDSSCELAVGVITGAGRGFCSGMDLKAMGSTGTPRGLRTFQKATAAVDGCGGVRLHDLRHTCASLAISAGANVKVVQRLLGHKTAVLTLDRYGHLFPDDLDAAARTTADALRTVRAPKSIGVAGNTH